MDDPTVALAVCLDELEAIDTDDLTDGSLNDLATRLTLCDRIVAVLQSVAADLTESMAARMDADEVELPGLGWATREPQVSVSWDNPAARKAVRMWVLDRLSVDRFTGERRDDWRQIADDALAMIERTLGFGSKPKRGFATEAGLDPDEFRTVTPRGYRVNVRTVTP